ncbi:hypothetical protein [Paenibacillus alvei]|uniref:hypothetical protein n=1 Tax=Paenibacillus alvei TaxID=44250 RepID=UPI0013DD4C1C|nr:hypothetical protein [Paenibacillus alvei]
MKNTQLKKSPKARCVAQNEVISICIHHRQDEREPWLKTQLLLEQNDFDEHGLLSLRHLSSFLL